MLIRYSDVSYSSKQLSTYKHGHGVFLKKQDKCTRGTFKTYVLYNAFFILSFTNIN